MPVLPFIAPESASEATYAYTDGFLRNDTVPSATHARLYPFGPGVYGEPPSTIFASGTTTMTLSTSAGLERLIDAGTTDAIFTTSGDELVFTPSVRRFNLGYWLVLNDEDA